MKLRLRTAAIGAALIGGAVALYVGWGKVSPTARWRDLPRLDLRVAIIDYTVPFENYREHAGVIWVLNHLKVARPDDYPMWVPARHYTGYSPVRRDRPVRLHELDLAAFDLVYVADTYGVYRDDLEHIDEQIAHMDYSPLVFGGLSADDGRALLDHVARGGAAIAEFNTFCEPTSEVVRVEVQAVFGVEWTGWVGRVFQNPADTDDVPHWFPREFERQFPDRPFPRGPIFVMVGRGGELRVFEGEDVDDVAPRVVLTEHGRRAFPEARSGAPYYYWFAIVRPTEHARVYAELALPERSDVVAALVGIDAPPAPPAMVTNPANPGRTVYFAGDFGEPDFEPGPFGSLDAIATKRDSLELGLGVTQAPVFWMFYAPVVTAVLRELTAARNLAP